MNMSELKFEEWWKEYSNSEESDECFNGVQDLKITALNAEQKKQIFAGIMVLLENVARKVWNTRHNDAKAMIAEDVFLQLAHSHSQMLQTLHNMFHPSAVKHAQFEQGVAEYMQDNGLMEKYFAVCEDNP